MGTDVLKKFGRYFLLDQIAQGGMAEIYRARLASEDGAGRLLVIKRIQAGYGDNRDFLQMFKSEIKVTMGLSHPNIAQLYDFGEENRQPFIAMEYIDGKNLRQFNSRVVESQQLIPIELAVHIIKEVANGLFYAHQFKDKLTGQPLNIVHRDISPQNILVSYEGNVKIIDFGIAKSSTNVEATRVNVIKGKPSYLSPEQITGEQLDGRSDVFSLGAVLWEILTGKKLFAGDNDRAILMLIESSQSYIQPPSTLNRAVPPELDRIVMKSLAKNRDQRFQTADEFQRALHKFLYSYKADFNPSDLGDYLKEFFTTEVVEDRKRIQKLNDEAEKLLGKKGSEYESAFKKMTLDRDSTEAPTLAHSKSIEVQLSDSKKVQIQKGDEFKLQTVINHTGKIPPKSASSRPLGNTSSHASVNILDAQRQASHRNKRSRSGLSAAIWAFLLLSGTVFYAPDLGWSIPYVTPWVEALRVGKWINPFDVKNMVALSHSQKSGLDRSPGNVSNQQKDSGEAPAHPDQKSISLRLNLIPPGGNPTILLGGKPVDPARPVATVPLDAPLDLVVKREGYRPLQSEFVIHAYEVNGSTEWMREIQLEPLQFGYLTIKTTPSADAVIEIDGQKWLKRTPFERERIRIGNYTIRLINESLGMEKTISTEIKESMATLVDERLEVKN